MEEDRSNELLLGTKEVDAGLAWLSKNAKKAGEWYKDASADQEGIGDDILRLLGGGAKNVATVAGAVYEAPLLKQGFQALDALSYYGGKVGGAAARAVNVDPRIGGAIGNVAGEVLTGFGAKAGLKYGAKAAKATKNYAGAFYGLASGTAMGTGAHGATGSFRKLTDINQIKRLTKIEQAKLEKFRKTPEGAEQLSKAYELYNTQGSLEGLERVGDFIARKKNPFNYEKKRGLSIVSQPIRDLEAAKRAITESINIPNVERALGDQVHRLDEFVTKVATDLRGVEGKRSAFNRYLRSIGKAKGSTDASLGHIKALKNLGIHLAENIRFETLGRNAARQAVADPPDRLLRALNIPITWDDAVKQFLDPESVLRHPAHILTPQDKYSILYEGANFDRVLSARKSINQAAGIEWLPSIQRFAAKHKLKIKKTKLQWDDTAQTAFKQMKAGNLPEARWRKSNIEFTWAPKDLGGKGRGYIDVIKDVAGDDDYFALQKQFFEKIKTLPSGTEWTLEADTAQKYRLYKRMFRGDPRITPGGDTKLLKERGIDHFVLRIP